jgi:hypothetical protein
MNAAGWVAVIVALGGQVAILLQMYMKLKNVETKVDGMHTADQERKAQLVGTIVDAGVAVPVDPNVKQLPRTNPGDMDK